MKKSAVLAGAIVLAGLAYTGAAWYVGVQSEKTIRAAVDRANDRIVKTLGPDLGTLGATIEVEEYRRGLFSTNARYTVIVRDGDEQLELAMHDHMQHGPFPWDLVKRGSFTPLLAYSRSQLVDTETVKRWFDSARGAMPLTVDTRIGFGGAGVSMWEFAPLEWAMDDDRLSFSGGRMEVRFSNEFRDNEGDGSFASFVMGNGVDNETITLRDIRLRSRTATAADETVQVHTALEAASLVVEDMADESLTVQQVSATFDSRQRGSLLDATLRYDFQRVLVGEIDLGSISVGGEVARFNFEAFSALLSEYDAIAREHGAGEDEDFDLTQEDGARLLARLVPALAASPEVALQPVIWRNEKGESTLAVSAAFQPLPEGDVQVQEEALTQAVRELRFELVLSRPMLLQAISRTGGADAEQRQLEMLAALMYDRYVDQLEREGLLRRDGDQALATIVYGEGEVNVNGRSMSLNEFLERFGGFLM